MKEWENREIRWIVDHYKGSRLSEDDLLRFVAGDIGIGLNISREKALLLAQDALHPYEPLPESHWIETRGLKILLEEAHSRQAIKLAHLFAAELNLSEEEYIASLPPFPIEPRPFTNSELRPLIVEGNRIPWRQQARLSRINEAIGLARLKDWGNDPQGFVTPEKPYTTWVSASRKTLADVHLARNSLPPGARGGTMLEGISYWNAYANIIKGGFFSLPGSQLISCYRYPPDYIVQESEELPIYLDCQKYEGAQFRTYGGDGAICHTLISSRKIIKGA